MDTYFFLSTVNAKYATDLENGMNSNALTEADGLLVVGFFFEVSESFAVLNTLIISIF